MLSLFRQRGGYLWVVRWQNTVYKGWESSRSAALEARRMGVSKVFEAVCEGTRAA